MPSYTHGGEVYFDISIVSLEKREKGDKFGYLLQVQNIITRKQLEKQLIQSEILASLGLLVSGVAHEINNPNNFVSFNMPILREYIQGILPVLNDYANRHRNYEISGLPYTDLKKDIFKLINNMEHGSFRINQIVNSLKSFGKQADDINLTEIDLKNLINKAISICQDNVRDTVATFDVTIPAELPTIISDARIIEQLLINLLVNAAQASNKKDSWIKLEVKSGENFLTDHLTIDVSDNGTGMDQKNASKIIDPFFTTRSPEGGTGLGLSISRRMIEQIGGRIEFASEIEKGSIFKIKLPLNS